MRQMTPTHRQGLSLSRALLDALKPHLRRAGIARIEAEIGRTRRFFQNARHRHTMQLVDFLASCIALELDPGVVVSDTLAGLTAPDIRPPRIVEAAQRQIHSPGTGLGGDRLSALSEIVRSAPAKSHKSIKEALPEASADDVPTLLGLYGSALRIQAKLPHARLVLETAREIARLRDLEAVEARLLIRLAHVSFEQDRLRDALAQAKEATLISTRLDDLEGAGRGFLESGILRFYTSSYRQALRDFQASLARSRDIRWRFSAHLNSSHCLLALGDHRLASRHASKARQLAGDVEPWLVGKLSWLDARLARGDDRYGLLKSAQETIDRPGDCLLVTVELIEEYLAGNRLEQARAEVPRLCTLVEEAAEGNRVQQAVTRLISRRSVLTEDDVGKLRQALEYARDRRLSRIAGST